MSKIYVSGKIGKLPVHVWKPKFIKFKNILSTKYDEVVTPVDVAEKVDEKVKNVSYADYLLADLCVLSECTHIYMLKDWRKSLGAKAERAYAKACKIKVVYERWEMFKLKWQNIFKKN